MTAFSLPASPGFNGVRLRLVRNRELIQSPLTRTIQMAFRPGDKWVGTFSLPDMRDREAAEAWAAALIRGIEEPFYLSPPFTALPLAGGDPGTPLVAGAPQTGRTLDTDGWTAGYALKAGDWFSFDNGSFEELHKLKTAVTASGGGVAELALARSIVLSPANNAPLRVSWPRGEFVLAEPEAGIDVDDARFYTQRFTAIEFP